MNITEIRPGQTIAYRKTPLGRRAAIEVTEVERVSERSVYLRGNRARVNGETGCGQVSVLLTIATASVELIEAKPAAAAKPTEAQARFITAVADGHAAPQNVVGDWAPIKAAMANGWVEQYRADDSGRVAYRILPAGLEAIGRGERPEPATGPCVVCGKLDSQSFGGEPECTPCAKAVNAEMKAARLAGSCISVAEARQRAMRALAKGAEMAREMAQRMWGRCHAGRKLDAVARAFQAGDFRLAYELAAAQVARQDANAGCVQDVEQAHAEALEAEAGLRPKYTSGTRQYREYMAALKAELAKWVAGEAPYERAALDEIERCSCVTH